MDKFFNFCERAIFGALCVAIILLGVGRVGVGFVDQSLSAWSVSRTTLGFWLLLKIIFLLRHGRPGADRAMLLSWAPLAWFFVIVTASLLPDFRSAGDYRYFALAVGHALMVADLCAAPSRRRTLLLLMAVAPAVLVVRGVLDVPEVFKFSLDYRFDHPLDHPNTVGYLLAMSIPLCGYVLLAETGAWRGLAAVSVIGQIFAMLLTYSRGAWLGLAAALFVFAGLTKRWKSLVAMLAALAICVIGLPSLRDRVFSVLRPSSDPAIRDRLQIARQAFQVGVEHPILGVGYGRGRLKEALRSRYQGAPDERGPIWHTHNLYIELFAETGLLGLGAFVVLVSRMLWRLLRSAARRGPAQRLLGFALASSWTGATVAGLGDIPFHHHEPRVFFFSLLALGYLYCRESDPRSCTLRDSNAANSV
jgi:O-antigen ligase